MKQQVWFITGSSRGFGRELVKAALKAGDSVAATARKPEQLSDLVAEYGDRILPLALDVTSGSAAKAAIAQAIAHFGRIDVLVNNAGYANVSPIESTPEDDFRAQFDTNFWGVYNVSKAAVPVLRTQGHGLIVQFSSIGGRVGGVPGLGAYQAAKFAVDGLSRSLATEVAPFGIKVLVVEPSGFATDWAGSSMHMAPVPKEYQATVGAMVGYFNTAGQTPAGDPARGAEIIVTVAKRVNIPTHLPLGVNAVEQAQYYSNAQLAEVSAWEKVSRSADSSEQYPVEYPADVAPQQ